MTAMITFGSTRVHDDYVNSSWWFDFLERHVEAETGDLRRILDDDGRLRLLTLTWNHLAASRNA